MGDIKTTFTLAWKYEKRAAREFDRDMDQMVRRAKQTEREFTRTSRAVQSVYGKTGDRPRRIGGGPGGALSRSQKQAFDLYTGERDRRERQSRGMRAAGVSQQALMTAGRGGQMVGGAFGGAGGAAGFIGQTAGGVGGAVAGAGAQAAGVLAAGGTLGAAGIAAAVALPVMLVGVAAAAAAKLASGGLAILKTLEPGRRAIFRMTGQRGDPFAAEAAAAGVGLRPSAGIAAGGALARQVGTADPRTMRRMMQMTQAFGIEAETQAGMLGAFARKGGAAKSDEERLRLVFATGMTQALERGRLHELFGVMSSMAEGRAPGLRPLDQAAMAKFLGGASRPGFEAFKGAGGAFAMSQLQNFMTKSPMGLAVGMTAAGLGGQGTSFFDAFQKMQAGPFAGAGGVGPEQFVNQFARMAMGRNFGQLKSRQQQTLGFMFGQQQGIPMESAMKILQMGAAGDTAGFNKAMADSAETIEDKTLEVMTSGFNRFESLAAQWERLLMQIGEMLTPAVIAAVPMIIERMSQWAATVPPISPTGQAMIRTGTQMAIPGPQQIGEVLDFINPVSAARKAATLFGDDARDNGDSRNDVDGSAMGTHKVK